MTAFAGCRQLASSQQLAVTLLQQLTFVYQYLPLSTYHKIINGDSRQMPELKDNSMHLAITSPPYWQLKDYGTDNQIGFHDSYESYINHLNLVWKECYRVLHNGCRLCINIGDQFARSVYYGRYKVIPIRIITAISDTA